MRGCLGLQMHACRVARAALTVQKQAALSLRRHSRQRFITPPLHDTLCSLEWGGTEIRPEATGYGAVFIAEEVLMDQGGSLQV
jgi:hypothetical protein